MSPGLAASLASLGPSVPVPPATLGTGDAASAEPSEPGEQRRPPEAPLRLQGGVPQAAAEHAPQTQPEQRPVAPGAAPPPAPMPTQGPLAQGRAERVLAWYRAAVGRLSALLRQLAAAQSDAEMSAGRAAVASAVDGLVGELQRLAARSR